MVGDDVPRWLGLLGRKALFFWNARESSNNKELSYFTGLSCVTRHYRWWFGALCCLAAGAVAAAPRAAGTLRILSLLAGYWLAVALFFVTARYRLPLVPFLALPAAGLLAGLPALLRARGRSAATVLAVMALTAAAVFPPWFGFGRRAIDHDFQLGQIYLMRGDPAAARERLLRSLESEEAVQADVRNSLGAARFALGDFAGAEAEYRAALREGEFAEVWFNLGVVYEAMGPVRTGDAVRAYRRSLEINPLEGRAAANLDYLLRRGASGAD
jgi:tetratricopeptide (TPR) repeat protein